MFVGRIRRLSLRGGVIFVVLHWVPKALRLFGVFGFSGGVRAVGFVL